MSMTLQQQFYDLLGRLLGMEQMQSISSCKLGFAAGWAQRASMWLLFGCVALFVVAGVFYLRNQTNRSQRTRLALLVIRGLLLSLVFLLLAEPILLLSLQSKKRPSLWLLFDGTDSMGIADDLPEEERVATAKAVGLEKQAAGSPGDAAENQSPQREPSRIDYLRAMVQKKDDGILERLSKDFRLQAFVFDSPQGVRAIPLTEETKGKPNGKLLAEQLTTTGKVTAISTALTDLARRQTTANVSGLIVFSDFNQNAGSPAVPVAKQLGIEVYTVGVGATRAVDAAAEVLAEPFAHKDEQTTVIVVVKQTGLDGQTATVRLLSESLGSVGSNAGSSSTIGEKTVVLSGASQAVEFPYVPLRAGRFNMVAEVEPLPGEAVEDNNRASREITVLEDFLRLMFVEYEPTWEWRFIKEVFHRDRLVGMKGFRTFLYSSDPKVRKQNELFLPTMAPPRSEFFANDLIFIGDMPAAAPLSALSTRFCEMVKEFVGELGGGVVFLSGPRFGPQQLVGTPLADMLPVIVDPAARLRDEMPFTMRLTPRAAEYKFMQLGKGSTLKDLQDGWDNLGELPWYQPVLRKHPQATVLAEHPTATCIDGKDKQPLIAVRSYGRGEVVYLGFNETFRLRRTMGEQLFRQFWGQVMERLALNHTLGADKRFVVRTDRRNYQIDDPVTVTVDARNADYQPLSDADLVGSKLTGELVLPNDGGRESAPQPINLTQVKKGSFEARFPAAMSGEHRVRVTDPVSNKPIEWTFNVVSTPVERQRAIRNVVLQESLASETGGRSVDLKDIDSLVKAIKPVAKTETSIEAISLVNTWLCFCLFAGLLLIEWFLRKWINLP